MNYWENHISNIIQHQIHLKSKTNAADVLKLLFGNDVKIAKIENSKGIGADYYNSLEDIFFLTEESHLQNSASITVAYFLAFIKLTSTKIIMPIATLKVIKIFLYPFLIISIIIAIFSENFKFTYFAIGFYIIMILSELFINNINLLISKSLIFKYIKNREIQIPSEELNNLIKYVSARRRQIITLLCFLPLLVPCNYLYIFLKKLIRNLYRTLIL